MQFLCWTLNAKRVICTQMSVIKPSLALSGLAATLRCTRVHPLTWYTGNAEDVRVTNKEALQDVSRLVGINHNGFSGGLGAGADPNQRRQLFLLPQLLLLILQQQAKEDMEHETLCVCEYVCFCRYLYATNDSNLIRSIFQYD